MSENADRDRFDKFTERARKVISLSQEEAQRFQHNYIGTEHLLLGLVREGEGVAAKVLANLGVELNKVRSAVEFIIGRGDRIVLGEIGLTPRAKKVIELAVDEARRLNHHYIGTEHLLLGLVREGEGIAAGVLESLGVNLEKVRVQTIKVLSSNVLPSDTEKIVDPLSEQAQQVIMFAREEARRFRCAQIGTEHLLAGLLQQYRSDAVAVLQHFGVQLANVRDTIEFVFGYGSEDVAGELALSPAAKKLVDGATEAVRSLKPQAQVAPIHLLLQLVQDEECIGAALLEILGVSPGAVLAQTQQVLSSTAGEHRQQATALQLDLSWRTEPEIDKLRQQYLALFLPASASVSSDDPAAQLKERMKQLEEVLRAKEQALQDLEYEFAAELRDREVQLRDQIAHIEAVWRAMREGKEPAPSVDAYPFKGIKLNRADIEWLLVRHREGRGPINWDDRAQRALEGLDLRGADLRGADLRRLPLTRLLGGREWSAIAAMHLEGADLRETHLEGANLFWVHLEGANLAQAYLDEANLSGAHLQEADLSGASLRGVNLSEAHLEQANLSAAHLEGANLAWAYLNDADLREAHTTEANLTQALLQGAQLSEAAGE